ncbi:outer membrane protein assembly factor BamE [Phenylobacterium sp. SCN 70-31]|uniref:outer membrane protein assembly factor BamE n=1 Tax=Phenylobacterium sp. SCN 70-31 TaxID=1660129 RepID=UPI000AF803E9|nr:outer membrane protein assembly factor BamE [Phenylobacterium sp. SCN 70-31]
MPVRSRPLVHWAFVAGLGIGGLTLGACTPIVAYSGFQAIDSQPKDLQIGVDTKSTVRAKLGSPSVQSTFDPNVWFYISQVKQRVAFRRPQVISRQVTALTFDRETEMVRKIESLDLGDGKQIAFSGRETPTRGREMTVLEQLLGSVGRGTMLPNQDQGVPGTRPGDRRR